MVKPAQRKYILYWQTHSVKTGDLEQWFEHEFWLKYKALTKSPYPSNYGSGVKGGAKKKILTMSPSAELRQVIILAINDQILHRNKLYIKCGSRRAYEDKIYMQKFYCNRNAVTWVNQMGWDDEIPEIEADQTHEHRADYCKCGRPSHFGSAHPPICIECVSRETLKGSKIDQLMREKEKEMGVKNMTFDEQRALFRGLKDMMTGKR